MKSPWQFISDLANRRRQRLAEQSSDPAVDDGPDRLLLSAPRDQFEELPTGVDAESQSGQPTAPPDEPRQDEVELRTEVSTTEPAGAGHEADRTTPIAPEKSGGSQTDIVPKAKTRVARAAKPASQHEPDVTQASDSKPEQLPVERTFHDDVRSVDDDIKQLRSELADKLRVQNEQLRKMLERFDRR